MIVALALGCAEPDPGEGGPSPTPVEPDSDTAATDLATDTGTVPSRPSCAAHEVPREIELTVGGEVRTALLAGPAELPEQPIPLVLNFHGYSDGASQQEGFSLMSDHAPGAGYVVAYPRGTGLLAGWNAGTCCGSAALTGVDDEAFTAALIEAIAEVACIDLQRVYSVGYSNGGFFSHKLACDRAGSIAGIASVAGVIGVSDCQPTRPIPVLQIHGTADLIVPYGGSPIGYPSVAETMEGWRVRNGCDDETVVDYDLGDATCVSWVGCEQPVALCTIDGGGHTWPGGTAPAIRGKVSTDLDATAGMWQFFQDAAASAPPR